MTLRMKRLLDVVVEHILNLADIGQNIDQYVR